MRCWPYPAWCACGRLAAASPCGAMRSVRAQKLFKKYLLKYSTSTLGSGCHPLCVVGSRCNSCRIASPGSVGGVIAPDPLPSRKPRGINRLVRLLSFIRRGEPRLHLSRHASSRHPGIPERHQEETIAWAETQRLPTTFQRSLRDAS